MTESTELALGIDARRYEALLRVSEALSVCREPEELSKALADRLHELIRFDHLDLLVFKQNSKEIEWNLVGEDQIAYGDLPVEERVTWHVYQTQQPLLIPDWTEDARFPGVRRMAEQSGLRIGSMVCVPLTTPHRLLGALGITSHDRNAYSPEDFTFLQGLARQVALALDDALNLRRSEAARLELERQNRRLKLLLDLTNKITSTLDFRELLRTVSANVRNVMECDGAGVTLPDVASGKFRVYAVDLPGSKGYVHEETLVSREGASARAFETLKPVIVNNPEPADFDSETYKRISGEGFKAHCFIPLVNHGRALGILGLARRNEDPFSEGDAEFLSQVAGQIAIAVENALAYREISELKEKLAQEKLYLEEEIRSELNFEQIIGESPALRQVLELVNTVAPSDSTVLLLGETGTGKELIARAIHDHSHRKDRTFVKLNCAAIPTGLLESELFGHERGAFTGAISRKIGRLELADQGTLFLDEVGDIPAEIQPKLLRALQEREFERLGSTQTKKVDVRLVAATNRDLEKMVAEREFRSDLYYRLNVFPIRIPPLRERKEDIPLLIRYFAQKVARRMQKEIATIPAAALKTLSNWAWPGNIRELENFVERAVILTRGKSLEVPLDELNKPRLAVSTSAQGTSGSKDEIVRIVRETITEMGQDPARSVAKEHDENQRQEIIRFLRETKGRVGGPDGAAVRMGIHRTTLLTRMRKFGIYAKQFS